MTRQLIRTSAMLDPEAPGPEPGSLLIEDGRVAALFRGDSNPPCDAATVELGRHRLAPGFIDLHHHGELVFTQSTGLASALRRTSASLARQGVTAFLPTTVAWSRERLHDFMTRLEAEMTRAAWPGAVPLGAHLEGPWINPAAAGAQPRTAIRPYDSSSDDRDLIEAFRGLIRVVTLAPEINGSHALLDALRRSNVVAAVGHSLAGEGHLDAAVADGLTHVTHLFNAMGGVHHRDLGVAGYALAGTGLSCDLVCDGVHVHPRMVDLAARALGDRLVLVSDRVSPPRGDGASFGSGEVRDDGSALRLSDGRLAGSSLTLDRAVRNATAFGAMSQLEAVAAVTLRPARVLGIESERGTLRPGARADFAVLDEGGNVLETWIAGRRVNGS